MSVSTEAMMEAVRSHPKIGRGSCSTIDECFSDKELIEALQENGCKTEAEAVNFALEYEGLRIEQATNCRWGEDNDPELTAYNQWNNNA